MAVPENGFGVMNRVGFYPPVRKSRIEREMTDRMRDVPGQSRTRQMPRDVESVRPAMRTNEEGGPR